MARTAGPAKNGHTRKEAPPPVSGDEEAFYRVKGELFWRWKAAMNEIDKVQLQIAENKRAFETELAKNPEIRRLKEEHTGLIQASSMALAELTETQAKIEQELGIDLKSCAIDDKTGRVHNMNADGTTTPKAIAVPSKRPKKTNGRSAGAASNK